MFLRRILAAIILTCLVHPAVAQKTKSQLSTEISTNFPDNTTGAITPSILRITTTDIVNSFQQFGGVNTQTGTTYTIQLSDYGQLVTFNNASSVAVTLPQATTSFATFNTYASNLGTGVVTITPTTSTINGASSLTLGQGQSVWIVADSNGNYQTIQASSGGISAKTCPGSQWFSAFAPVSGFTCSQPAFSDISGVAAASQLPNPTATTLGGIKSYAAVSHQWINQISTAGSPSSTQPACGDLSNSTSYCSSAIGQLPGTTTNDSASSGNIGEYISSVIATGSATSLTSGTAKNITSISLTAGDWDVSTNCSYNGAGSVSVTFLECGISTTTATIDQTNGRSSAFSMAAVVPGVSPGWAIPVQNVRLSLASTTTVYMVSQQTFTVGTLAGWGILQARRAR